MWSKNKGFQIIWALLLIQLVAAGTTRHRRSAEDAAEQPNSSDNVDADGFQTFTRRGVTLRIKPHSRTIRVGGENTSPEELLAQAKQTRKLDILAVRQLLNTKHPVKRTTFENGRKQTSTYTLEPDGSIVCKTVEDIDLADVDRRFEEIFKQQREKEAKERPNKIADWEWSEDYDEPAPSVFKAPLQPFPAGQPYVPTPPQSPQPAEQEPLWPQSAQDDPFNPAELPTINNLDDTEDDWDTYEKPVSTPKTQARPIAEESTSTTMRSLPSLDDFLEKEYNPSRKNKPEATVPSLPTSTTPRTIKTIKVDDLPTVAVLNANKPVDEQFLQPLTPNAFGYQRPIKTLHVENIPPSSVPNTDHHERTKVQTFTETFRGNRLPTVADLNPRMQDILRRSGIRPEDIANGQTVTKTRTEPDGRKVTTTYRINRTYNPEPSRFDTPSRGAMYPVNWPKTFDIQSGFNSVPPRIHQTASHFGVNFSPYSAGDVGGTITPTTTVRSLIRDREPLEPQDEKNEGAVTLNPLLIHPVQPTITASVNNPISVFLAKCGLSFADLSANRGQYVRTIVNPDGSVLTATFRLTGAIVYPYK